MTLRLARALTSLTVLGMLGCTANATPPDDVVIAHDVKDIDGKPVSLASYRGKVLLLVNVASECGFTPQYADLEKLYESERDKGVEVLGFPSNDFGGQEPGDAATIKQFTKDTYGVTFKLFEKVHTNGPEAAPLYHALTSEVAPQFRGPIKWNFTKFVVDKTGHVVARFPSETTPLDPALVAALDRAAAR
jgi:glutathione peroxidase